MSSFEGEGQVHRDIGLITINNMAGDLTAKGASLSRFRLDDGLLELWDLADVDAIIESGQLGEEDCIGLSLDLDCSSSIYDSRLRIFGFGEGGDISSRTPKLLGGMTFYSEPKTSGMGCHSAVFIYEDGHIEVRIEPRCLEETADEVHARYYEELDKLVDDVTEQEQSEEQGKTLINHKGTGRIEALTDRWHTILETVTSLS